MVGVGCPCPETASAGVGRVVSVGVARRTHSPVRGRVRGDRERAGRDRRCPELCCWSGSRNAPSKSNEPFTGSSTSSTAREGRDPTRFERAALEREAAADTRAHKTGNGVPDLRTRWLTEAADLGVTPDSLVASINTAADRVVPEPAVTVESVVEALSAGSSAWHRMDVLRAVCDRVRPVAGVGGERWVAILDRAVERVLEHCVDLDPARGDGVWRRRSDGRSLWIEPVADHYTSDLVLAQEEHILTWAIEAQTDDPSPSATSCAGTDSMCCKPTPPPQPPATTASW